MSNKTVQSIQDGLIRQFEKDRPGEKIYGKAFSLYLLERHARLLYRIYERSKK